MEEPAMLAALEEFLAPCQALVSFNGKAFDAPLLLTRFRTHGWLPPLTEMMHVDLLHLARRLWRDRLNDRSLGSLEAHILGVQRTEDDVPGWQVPSLFFHYLRSGDPEFVRGVFYHNAMDVLSLAALMDHMASMLQDPLVTGGKHGVDLIALAKLFEDLGDVSTAAHLYVHGLEHADAQNGGLPRGVLLQAIERLALIHKRHAEWHAAIELWQQAAHHRHLSAYVELAKCYEHNLRDYESALTWTQAAIECVQSAPTYARFELHLSLYERRQWIEQLEHRLARLRKKMSGRGTGASTLGVDTTLRDP
jgi:tetratricopeptide (TPR) repeat protein